MHISQHYPISLAAVNKQRFNVQALFDFGGKYIYHDNHDDTEYNRVCSAQLDLTIKNFLTKMGIIFAPFIVAVIGPVYAYFFKNMKVTTIEAHIPFCESQSNTEFFLNILWQIIVGTYGGQMYVGLEVFLSLYEDINALAPKLIKLDFDSAIQQYKEKKITDHELQWYFTKIVQRSQDADK